MRKKQKQNTNLAKTRADLRRDKRPIIEHVYELRRRLLYCALVIGAGSMVAYGVQQQIVNLLLRPAHGQNFIYTSPLGGINFLFGVCFDVGVIIGIPVIIYNLLRFIEPLLRAATTRFIFLGSMISGLVALGGITFGYFIGLPAALSFLLHQFPTAQIKPLVTIQAYLSFVSIYLLGSALMFQLPLFLIFINRIKPLKPKKLLKYERHVIVAAFVVGFIMNPTPNMIDQLLVVLPIILMYQVGIGLIWLINRGSKHVLTLQELDARSRAKRAKLTQTLVPLATPLQPEVATPRPAPVSAPSFQPVTPGRVRPRVYITDFVMVPAQRPTPVRTQDQSPA